MITLFVDGATPHGAQRTTVPAQTMRYIDFATLPEPPPSGTDFCVVLASVQPIVVQHVHREVHGDDVTILSSIAYSQPPG